MKAEPAVLGEFEQMVLLAVMQLEHSATGAFGTSVFDELTSRAKRRVSRGAIYMTLDRLEQKGLLTSTLTAPTPARGGKAKRCYVATRSAKVALDASRRSLMSLWEGLDFAYGEEAMTRAAIRLSLGLLCITLFAVDGIRATQGPINTRGWLMPGETVPPLVGIGLDGRTIDHKYGGQRHPTVLYVVSKNGGGFVQRNEAHFAALLKGASERYTFVLLCPNGDDGSLATYVDSIRPQWQGRPVTVIASVSDELRNAMSLFSYPQTIVVSTDSKVLANFRGAYGPRETSPFAPIDDVARFFGVTFADGR